jgi:aminoglycoside phosphotransferase (APT) family kinase protein
MSSCWSAELVVSPSLACELIESQFPQLAPVRVALLGEGWDNTAYLVNDRYVFRFPRRQLGADCLAAEVRALPALAGRLPLPVPNPVFIGRPPHNFPWLFAGYAHLPGRTACVAALDELQRMEAAEPLARFLRTLHAIGADEAAGLGAAPDTIARLDLDRRIPQFRGYLQQAVDRKLIDDPSAWDAVIAAVAGTRQPRASSLVHGDLYARHLLVDDDRRLCGVIDWGDMHIGDPAIDLAIAHSFLPPAAHAAFRNAYGPIDDETWNLARFRAVSHAVITLVYGHDIGDADLVRESRIALGHLA